MLAHPVFAALGRVSAILIAPLMLASCVLTPGKFTSTLTILADRSFSFSYVGEVYAVDTDNPMKSFGGETKPVAGEGSGGWGAGDDTGSGAAKLPAGQLNKNADKSADAKAQRDAKNREIARTLAKEEGYRSVTYVGDGKFMIDYALRGTLTHSFVYPYNIDAEVIFPFISIELRKGGIVRMTAPAFANDNNRTAGLSAPGMSGSGSGDAANKLDGEFTLTTDAEIISQNNEDGATVINGRKTLVWKATPLTKTAPSAVLKLALPVPVPAAVKP